MENRVERVKRFAEMYITSRYESGKSQEYMALGLGVSKKTIQNWEKGISSPTFFQSTEWFRLLGINPLKYYLKYVYPNFGEYTSNEQLTELVETLPDRYKEALVFLLSGNHGSSPVGVLNLVLAHLQSPLSARVSNASAIYNSYDVSCGAGLLSCPNEIQPDVKLLEQAITSGRNAAKNKEYGYSGAML